LKQVVGLQQQLDSLNNDRDKLSNKVQNILIMKTFLFPYL